MTDGEESCYDHEVERQSSLDYIIKLMDILGIPLYSIYKRALREYKIQIKTNAKQEIAELLKAGHGVNLNKYLSVCLPDGNGAQNWRLFHDIGARSIYGTSEACLRYYLGHSLPATAGIPAAHVNYA